MAASQTKKGTIMFTIDGWGNVTIVIHLDTLIGFILVLVLLTVTLTLALSYKRGFIQWFKDYL